MSNISIIVPVYNSEQTLSELVERLERVLSSISKFEVILVNDGSRDNSWKVINELSLKYNFVRGIDMMTNFGQHNALLFGIRAAKGETIITMDDDLQNPPEEIPALLIKLEQGYDVVYGTPEKQRHGLFRDLASSITKLTLQGAMGIENATNISAFRAFRTKLREGFSEYNNSYVCIDVLLSWVTRKFTYVIVKHDTRKHGVSNYTMRKLLTHAVNMFTGFSAVPLQLASIIGFVFMIFGFCVFGYVVAHYFIYGGLVPGFTFLAGAISLFSGVQLFTLGIIGEYLSRIHFRSMGKSAGLVRQTINF